MCGLRESEWQSARWWMRLCARGGVALVSGRERERGKGTREQGSGLEPGEWVRGGKRGERELNEK